jgi:hypothetical protein
MSPRQLIDQMLRVSSAAPLPKSKPIAGSIVSLHSANRTTWTASLGQTANSDSNQIGERTVSKPISERASR